MDDKEKELLKTIEKVEKVTSVKNPEKMTAEELKKITEKAGALVCDMTRARADLYEVIKDDKKAPAWFIYDKAEEAQRAYLAIVFMEKARRAQENEADEIDRLNRFKTKITALEWEALDMAEELENMEEGIENTTESDKYLIGLHNKMEYLEECEKYRKALKKITEAIEELNAVEL